MGDKYPHLTKGRATVTANREAKRPVNQRENILADLRAGLPHLQISFRNQAGLNLIIDLARENGLTRYKPRKRGK